MTDASRAKAVHFRNRLHERHGIHLTIADLEVFIAKMRGKEASVRLNCRLGLHSVDMGEKKVAVLWDRKSGVPVTCLHDRHRLRLRGTNKAWEWDGETFRRVR